MKNSVRGSLAASVLVVLAMAGCSSAGSGTAAGTATPDTGNRSASAAPSASDMSGSTDQAGQAALKTADSSLGNIVVDGKGMSVYVYDLDTPGSGKSVCEGECLAQWPALKAKDSNPVVDGVTGTVGTITRSDGSLQVTLNGSPLYLFAGDSAAGDVNGQGFDGIWWVVDAKGTKISEGAAG